MHLIEAYLIFRVAFDRLLFSYLSYIGLHYGSTMYINTANLTAALIKSPLKNDFIISTNILVTLSLAIVI